MNAEQLSHWLRVIGARQIDPSGSAWVRCSCPLAESRHRRGRDRRPSFGARVERGESRVYCLACGYAGTQTELLHELTRAGHDFVFAEARRLIVEAEEGASIDGEIPRYDEQRERGSLVPYPETMIDALEPAYSEELSAVHWYLGMREVTVEYAARFDLRWDEERHRVVFPIRDYGRVLVGLHGRLVVEPEPDELAYYAYPSQGQTNLRFSWYGEHEVDRDEPVVLVESVFDHARVWEVYENLLSPLRASISREQLARIAWARRVVTFFDGDEAGDRARTRVREALGGRAVHARPPDGVDPGAMSLEEIHQNLGRFL